MEQQIVLGVIIGVDEVLVGNNTLAGGNFWICGAERGIVAHNISSAGRILIAGGNTFIASPNLPDAVIVDRCEIEKVVQQILT